MAITQAVCNSFKQELLQGLHDLDGHTLKLALYTSSATLGPTTTAFSTTNESSGTNYTSGGATISNVAVSLSGTVAFVDFDDVPFQVQPLLMQRGHLFITHQRAIVPSLC